jgi:hypothetical protein
MSASTKLRRVRFRRWTDYAIDLPAPTDEPPGNPQGFQEGQQVRLRRELNARQAWSQRKPDACDDKKDRRSGVEPPCDDGHNDEHRKQRQKGLDRRRHPLMLRSSDHIAPTCARVSPPGRNVGLQGSQVPEASTSPQYASFVCNAATQGQACLPDADERPFT